MKNNITGKQETADAIRAATELLDGIRKDKMTFVQPLAAAERTAAPAFGPGKMAMLGQCLEVARNHREALPPSFAELEFEQRAGEMIALEDCRTKLESILSDVRDSQLKLAITLRPAARSAPDY